MPKRYWYVILTYVLVQLSGAIGVPLLHLATGISDSNQLAAYWTLISFPIGLVIILFLLKPDMKENPIRGRKSIGTIVLWGLLGVILAYGAQIVAGLIETYVFNINPTSENTQFLMEIAKSTPFFIVFMVLGAPILEEIIFRKVIFGSIYKKTNFWIAALSSSLIFATIHWDFAHILKYTAAGLVFAFLYIQTKRIIVPIIAHMAINSIAVLIQFNISPEDLERMEKQLEDLQTIFIGG